MSYIFVGGLLIAACGFWFAIAYRDFGAAEAGRSQLRAAKRARFSERKPDDSGATKPGRTKRQFGRPRR